MSESRKPDPAGVCENKIRILIADDHVTVLEGLVAIIGWESDMTVVAKAGNGRLAVDLWLEHRPDVALLDLRMPQLDGASAIREIRQHDPSARIIILTTYDTDNEIASAIKAGARGYLLKDAPREELLDSIRRVRRDEICIPPFLAEKLAAIISSDTLSGREIGVVELLAQGLSNKEIATKLSICDTTVKAHLRSIFAKLNVTSRTEAISVAGRRGLIRF